MTADNDLDLVDEHVLVQESRDQWRTYAAAALTGLCAGYSGAGGPVIPDDVVRTAGKIATYMMTEDRRLWNWAIGGEKE